MNIQNVTWEMVVSCIGLILIVLAGYNTYSTARKNRREELERKNQPSLATTAQILDTLKSHADKLANDKARLDNL